MGGFRVQTRPTGEEADRERLTVSEKLFTEVIVMAEVPELPALIADGETAAAEIPKSATLTTTCALWETDPLVPVTIML